MSTGSPLETKGTKPVVAKNVKRKRLVKVCWSNDHFPGNYSWICSMFPLPVVGRPVMPVTNLNVAAMEQVKILAFY